MDNTKVVADMRRLTCEFVAAWEHGISDVYAIINDTDRTIEDFGRGRSTVCNELRDALARSKSLRKKDFDRMIRDIFLKQEETDKEVKTLVGAYFSEQRDMAGKVKKALSEGESPRVSGFLEMLGDIRKRQGQMENETRELLRGYRNEQEEMAKTLSGFLDKGEEMRIGDFKRLINEIQLRQKEREDEVRRMLDAFRAKRMAVNKGGDMERFEAKDTIAGEESAWLY